MTLATKQTSKLNVALIGLGLVGGELLNQIRLLETSRKQIPFNLVAVASSTVMVLGDALPWSDRHALLDTTTDGRTRQPLDLDRLTQHVQSLAAPAVVVDCTASDRVPDSYPIWLRAGLSVVTANKKGFAGPARLYNDIYDASCDGNGSACVYHESSVGAGLPVLSTLQDMVITGDKVTRIEGVFSGTLSYIFNEFSCVGRPDAQPKFSDVVQVAKEKGFTEPDPRDDLNGMDVARKVTILARVAGKANLELSSLPVDSLVPPELASVKSSEEFMQRLPEFDTSFAQKAKQASDRGEVLRYVGVVDLQGKESGVKLVSYPQSHPFAALTGSDNIVAFTTERFPSPLVIRGAGAGAAVTVFGVLSDMYKVQKRMSAAII